jgi:hypothetical protein
VTGARSRRVPSAVDFNDESCAHSPHSLAHAAEQAEAIARVHWRPWLRSIVNQIRNWQGTAVGAVMPRSRMESAPGSAAMANSLDSRFAVAVRILPTVVAATVVTRRTL